MTPVSGEITTVITEMSSSYTDAMWNAATENIAHVAAAIGDPSRTKVLRALAAGGVLPASALAAGPD